LYGHALFAFLLSAISTPTRIFDAFHNWTMLMTFLAKQTGEVHNAKNCAYVKVEDHGIASGRPMGVAVHFIR
jgi:hypothetical protein